MTNNSTFHGRAKHIDIKFHFIRDQVSRGAIKLEYCPTDQMIADILTKGLTREAFCKLREKSGVLIPPLSGGYTAEYLKAIVGQAKLYIRPIQKDLCMTPISDSDTSVSRTMPFVLYIIVKLYCYRD